MLEYYFPKVFTILECNDKDLDKPPNDVKQRINAGETDNSDKVMTCINTIPSTSNTLKNLVVNNFFTLFLYSNIIQRERGNYN